MNIKEFDTVLLKDGRIGDVMDIQGGYELVVDIVVGENDWQTIYITVDDVEKIIKD